MDVGKGKGRLGGLRPPYGVVGSRPCLGSELPDVMPGSEKTKPQREEKGWRIGRGGTREDICPGQFRKGALWWPREGPRENMYGKC